MKLILAAMVLGSVLALLFILERLFPLRRSTRSLLARLVVNVAISLVTFVVAIALVQPAAQWALRSSAPFGLVRVIRLPMWA